MHALYLLPSRSLREGSARPRLRALSPPHPTPTPMALPAAVVVTLVEAAAARAAAPAVTPVVLEVMIAPAGATEVAAAAPSAAAR